MMRLKIGVIGGRGCQSHFSEVGPIARAVGQALQSARFRVQGGTTELSKNVLAAAEMSKIRLALAGIIRGVNPRK